MSDDCTEKELYQKKKKEGEDITLRVNLTTVTSAGAELGMELLLLLLGGVGHCDKLRFWHGDL